MNHLSHHFNLFEATHFVLSGTSAGGFGVRLTFDDGGGVLTMSINSQPTSMSESDIEVGWELMIIMPPGISRFTQPQVGLNCDDVADWLHANNPEMCFFVSFCNCGDAVREAVIYVLAEFVR